MKTTLSMDRHYIDENQIIDRYLMNTLSDEETEIFEQLFMEDPELVQEIEFRKRFIRGLRKADRTGSLQLGDDKSSSLWQWLPVVRPSFPVVAAVSAAIVLVVAVLQYSQIARLQSVIENQVNQISQLNSPQANTLLVPLGRTRGVTTANGPVIRVHLSSWVEQVILTPEIELLSFDGYRLSLDREGAGQIWSGNSGSAPPAIILPAELLIPGDYHLNVSGIDGGGANVTDANYSFTVLGD